MSKKKTVVFLEPKGTILEVIRAASQRGYHVIALSSDQSLLNVPAPYDTAIALINEVYPAKGWMNDSEISKMISEIEKCDVVGVYAGMDSCAYALTRFREHFKLRTTSPEANQQFLKAWNQFDPIGRRNRGLLSLMRRHYGNLREDQVAKLENYFVQFPHLKIIWQFKQKLHDLMRLKQLSKETTWLKIHDLLPMIRKLKTSPIDALRTLGETLSSWRNEIGRMWRFSKTNSITEGLHNKMEMISRRAFGFRNFQNYRMRVMALCGWDGIINRKTLRRPKRT